MQNELIGDQGDALDGAVGRIQQHITTSQALVANLPDDVRPAAFAQVLKWVGEADFAGVSSRRTRQSSSRAPKAVTKGNEVLDKPKNLHKSGPSDWAIELIESGFFGLPRTAAQTSKELKQKHGRTVPPKDMAKVLLRLLQAGRLTRTVSAEKGYEYSKG
jgi:hypothetical protein